MANDGWLKAYRKIREHPVWSHDGMFKLLFHCLFEANYKPSQYMIPGTIDSMFVDRGSFITGREVLYKDLYPGKKTDNPDPRTVARWLRSLEQMGVVKLQNVSNRCTLVTVVNYETYQSSTPESCPTDAQPVSNQCPAGVQPTPTSEEGKKGRKKESTRREFVKPTVEEVTSYCRERANQIDAQEFLDYWDSVGWRVGKAGKPMKDWKATIRTKEKMDRERQVAKQPPKQRVPDIDEILRRGYNPQTGLGPSE